MAKFYAVKEGKRIGVYNTWDECKEQITGYSGAKYKSFKTLEEAKDFSGVTEIEKENQEYYQKLCSGQVHETKDEIAYTNEYYDGYVKPQKTIRAHSSTSQILIETKEETPQANEYYDNKIEPIYGIAYCSDGTAIINKECNKLFYVDGSYNDRTKTVGYGLVEVINGQAKFRDFGSSFPGEDVSSRNVLGELKGAMKAMDLALANNLSEITICYDYKGVELWATGGWKASKDLTKYYRNTMQNRMKHVKVNFVKIEAHSGDKWNDEADRLAKMGAGV